MRELDVRFRGVPHAICCFDVDGTLVDPGPESCVAALLAALGDVRPRRVLLTHIHLDHAGATGALVERWPDLEVWVHRNGARHVVDPSKLVASAGRIYGDEMERLWGRIVPVPEANVRVLEDEGEEGPWRWAWTPGHAVHHVAYLHGPSGVAYVGDVGGVRIGTGPTVAPTPPPDIDLEAWHRSIELVRSWRPSALASTHFGAHADVDGQLDDVGAALDRWAAAARDLDAAGFERAVRSELSGLEQERAYLAAMPPDTLYGGLARYWHKRDT